MLGFMPKVATTCGTQNIGCEINVLEMQHFPTVQCRNTLAHLLTVAGVVPRRDNDGCGWFGLAGRFDREDIGKTVGDRRTVNKWET